jgi:hypothetical protein
MDLYAQVPPLDGVYSHPGPLPGKGSVAPVHSSMKQVASVEVQGGNAAAEQSRCPTCAGS